MTLYTASKALPVFVQRCFWAAGRIGAARLVPGPRVAWDTPFETDEFVALQQQWRGAAGAPTDALAVYHRPQPHRESGLVLVCGRRPMVVRFHKNPEALALERRFSEEAARRELRCFRVPRVYGDGQVGGWHWVGYEAMSTRPHAPAATLAPGLADEATALVEAVLTRGRDVPLSWRGAHGDLTPWNLRRAGGALWLIDWEDARFAPQGADEVYFEVSRAAFLPRSRRRAEAVVRAHPEAAQFWIGQLEPRPVSARDVSLERAKLQLLRA